MAAQISLVLVQRSARRKDVPSLLRKFYLTMAGMVRNEMFYRDFPCEFARASVSHSMLSEEGVVKDPVVVQAWRGAASLLINAGDVWVSRSAAGPPHACIGGEETWAASVLVSLFVMMATVRVVGRMDHIARVQEIMYQ